MAPAQRRPHQGVRAYLRREEFQFFWHYRAALWAGRFLDRWCTQTMRSQLPPMKRVAAMRRRLRLLQPFCLQPFPKGSRTALPVLAAR